MAMGDQVQEKLNRVATSSGAANLFVGVAAVLEVMTDVYAKRAKRNDTPDQVTGEIARGNASIFQ